MATHEDTDKAVRAAVNDKATAKDIRASLGRGGHFALSGAVKRMGLKPSKPGTQKGLHTYFEDDTTFEG